MDISLTPDTYTPIVDQAGNYIDSIPVIRHGLYCLCGSRKDKAYENTSKFATHIKTKTHQKWLEQLNQNRANYYVECIKHKDLVKQQQKLIAQLENRVSAQQLTIDCLTKQLVRPSPTMDESVDLLDMSAL